MFSETQQFRQIWVWLLLASAIVIRAYFYFFAHIHSRQHMWSFFIIVAVTMLFFTIKLTTRIDETGIYYRFFPFHLKERKIIWDDIAEIYVRKYSPIAEYGGWGLRGITNKNRAFNTSGNWGIQIVYKNGNRLLLGTQKKEEADKILKQLTAGGTIVNKA